MEDILRLRCERDFSAERYLHAVELFLNEHPNGELRCERLRPDGHDYPKERKRKRMEQSRQTRFDISSDEGENIEDINLGDISSDEWTESHSDY